MPETIQKIQELRSIYIDENDQNVLIEFEKKVKRALLTLNLKENDGIKMILEKYEKDIANINTLLLKDENMKENERQLLFLKRKWCEDFINLFKIAESTIEHVDSVVNNNIFQAQEDGLIE